MTSLNVLVACECSGRVRDAFRTLGHNAWSCDLQPCDQDADSTYHVIGDALALLDRRKASMHCAANGWDILVAHPPCTYLCNSGVHWLWKKRTRRHLGASRHRNWARWIAMRNAAAFFRAFYEADVKHIAIENPIPHRYGELPPYDQIVQPWQFGDPESKATCLWLKGLPNLKPTLVLPKPESGMWENQTPSGQNKLGPSPERAKLRSKTYEGIALAMASQWAEHVLHGQDRAD